MTYEEAKNILMAKADFSGTGEKVKLTADALCVAVDALEKAEKYAWHDRRKNYYSHPKGWLDDNDCWNYHYISCNSSGGIRCRYIKSEPYSDPDHIFEVMDAEGTIAWKYIEPFQEVQE